MPDQVCLIENKIAVELKREVGLKNDLVMVERQLNELNANRLNVVANLMACTKTVKYLRELVIELGDKNAVPTDTGDDNS